MPASGYPLALEKALEALFEENILTSWHIRGGKFTTVSLTFRQPDNQNGACAASSQIAYRAKPPSALRRDTARKNNWIEKKKLDFMQSPTAANRSVFMDNLDAEIKSEDLLSSNTALDIDIDSTCDTEGQHGQPCETVCDTDKESVVSCSTPDSTTGDLIGQNKDKHMQTSHVTPIDGGRSFIQTKSKNQYSRTPPLTGLTPQKVILPNWTALTCSKQMMYCCYCAKEIFQGEWFCQCPCPREYILCKHCCNKDGHTQISFHVCSRPKLK